MKTLLAVFAHPDDETFGPGGTLAKYAAQGVAVHLLCATRGEMGEDDAEGTSRSESLAHQREWELRCAADILGLADVHLLGYRDSGMAGSAANHHPRALAQADLNVLVNQIADLVRLLRPQVLLTFDPYGGYGHPDHIATHDATVAAFNRLPVAERPQKLYFTTFERRTLRWLVWLMPLLGIDPEAVGRNRDINLREALEHELAATTRVDVKACYDLKRRAAACHASQLSGPSSIWLRLPRGVARRLQSRDSFYRVAPGFDQGQPMERDLFDGIT